MTTLIDEIAAFMAKHNMKPTRFSRDATGDPTFVTGLQNGRDVKYSTAEKVRAFMKNYKPAAKPARKPKAAASSATR